MLSQVIGRYFKALRSSDRAALTDGLYSSKQFLDLLDRERGRADRNSHGFSLVIFDLDSEKTDKQIRALAKMLHRRMRATDIAGWVDEQRVGILLPETYNEGARTFAEHISQELVENRMPSLSYTVRTYPPQKPSDPGSHPGSGSGRGGDEQRRGREGERPTVSTRPSSTRSDSGESLIVCRESEATDAEARRDILALCAPAVPRWKRVIDIAGASAVLLLSSPLMLAVTALIKIVSPGPVFFKQERVGYLGNRFTMWKFRTMHVGNDTSAHREYVAQLIQAGDGEEKPMVKQENNPSIIAFGKILRAASIDELPQLFNVLRGEMSLVGPRPPIPYEAEEYLHWHSSRFETVPGMTGLWQVSGKNTLTFKEMVRLDIRYARNLSFWQDVKILVKTFPVVVALAFEKFSRKLTKEAANVAATQETV